MPWLKDINSINLLREKVEKIDQQIFKTLWENDILFIDSSHMIRSGWDVLTEFLEILPQLNKGVIVHIHDIYTPYDYPSKILNDVMSFNNEQYLLESFLSLNDNYEILWALNYLKNTQFEQIKSKFPILAKFKDSQPWSFWIRKIK